MIRALDNGDGMCSFMHNLISLLLTASRPGLRALDREADPVAGWQVIPRRRARAADGARSVGDEKPAERPWRRSIARLHRGTRTCLAARSGTSP